MVQLLVAAVVGRVTLRAAGRRRRAPCTARSARPAAAGHGGARCHAPQAAARTAAAPLHPLLAVGHLAAVVHAAWNWEICIVSHYLLRRFKILSISP